MREATEILFRLAVVIRVESEDSVERVTLLSPLMDYEPAPNQRVKVGEVEIFADDGNSRTYAIKGVTQASAPALNFVKGWTVTNVDLNSLGSLGIADKGQEIVNALVDAGWEPRATP